MVAGALAYDQITTTRVPFPAAPEPLRNTKLDSLTEQLGGCGGNLAYNLATAGSVPLLLSCYGRADGKRYLQHLRQLGINTNSLWAADGPCARSIIVTDPDGEQFCGFFPGPVPDTAAWQKHLARLQAPAAGRVLVQGPYPAHLMAATLAWGRQHKLLNIWCPGQYADQLQSRQVQRLAADADWICGNGHEIDSLNGAAALPQRCGVIRTNGAQPVQVTLPDELEPFSVPVQAPERVADPTGCGDALAATLALHCSRLAEQPPLQWSAAAISAMVDHGCRVAASCLAHEGAQNHPQPPPL